MESGACLCFKVHIFTPQYSQGPFKSLAEFLYAISIAVFPLLSPHLTSYILSIYLSGASACSTETNDLKTTEGKIMVNLEFVLLGRKPPQGSAQFRQYTIVMVA